ncbi:MAG: type II secretion system F family protein [Candidatus Dojkabacteria bacterium]
MAEFKYIAVSNTGQRIEGVKEAETQSEVTDYLNGQGMMPVIVQESVGVNFKKLLNVEIGGMTLEEKVVLIRQLSTMVGAGIPIIQAIDILVQQADKDSTKEKLLKIYRMIEAGTALSDAFRKESGILNEVQVNLMAAGEKSGNLNEILLKIAEDLEKSKNLNGKIKGALIYPAIIFVVMIAVLILMIVVMVPQVKQLYNSLGQTELPFVTNILISIGNIFTNLPSLIITIIVIISAVFGFKYFVGTPNGRKQFDGFKLKLPVFGNLIQKIEIVEFCRLLSMLMVSGIPIIESLDIVGRATGNVIFRDIILGAKDDLAKGSSLALALAKYNTKNGFPLIIIRMIATGEEAGSVDVVLRDLAKFYEDEVDQIAGNLTKLIEPFILVVVGVLVGFMAIAIYLPIYQVGQIVNK